MALFNDIGCDGRGGKVLRVFITGLSTGLVLQLAIGPVFFFILNISLQRTLVDGLCSVFAVTVVDYFYIILAIIGVGKLLEKKPIQKKLALISSVVLIIFGVAMLVSSRGMLAGVTTQSTHQISNYWSSFLSALLLTISSPLTIVFWTGLFAAKAIEYNYTKRQLVIFGISAGLATVLFLGCSVVVLSFIKASVPLLLVRLLNVLVGVLLILYGAIRFFTVIKSNTSLRIGEERF